MQAQAGLALLGSQHTGGVTTRSQDMPLALMALGSAETVVSAAGRASMGTGFSFMGFWLFPTGVHISTSVTLLCCSVHAFWGYCKKHISLSHVVECVSCP